jgi:hypothetical protein
MHTRVEYPAAADVLVLFGIPFATVQKSVSGRKNAGTSSVV